MNAHEYICVFSCVRHSLFVLLTLFISNKNFNKFLFCIRNEKKKQKQTVDSSEEIPLKECSSSDENHPFEIKNSQRDQIELTTRVINNDDCFIQRINSAPATSTFLRNEISGAPVDDNKRPDRYQTKNQRSNLRDINAMSVASIYDTEHKEIMDTDK